MRATILDSNQIQELLPHRWPMLMIDRVVELDAGRSAVAEKCVSLSDVFMLGHFPGRAVMPGVLLVEAMAQVCLLAALSAHSAPGPRPLFFLGSADARFLKAVVPGMTLSVEAKLDKLVGGLGLGSGRVLVDGELVARAKLSFGAAPVDETARDGDGR